MPPQVTQVGVTEAVWVDLRHLSQYIRPLEKDGLVRERTAHVSGARQRRKVYELTSEGQRAAIRLRERVRAEHVRVRDAVGVREMTVDELQKASGGAISLLALLRRSEQGHIIELSPTTSGPRDQGPHVALLMDAPRIDRFVGRQAELEIVTAEGAGPRVFVVRGVAGIGKSTFAAKVCEILRDRWNLFWHGLRPWDTRASILATLGGFLAALGKPGLKSVLDRGEASEAASVLREDLAGTKSYLVFDDAHHASREVIELFRWLKDAVTDAPDVRILVLARRFPPFYDRRDVAVRSLVRELDLTGLSTDDIAVYLSQDRLTPPGNVANVGGHPLLLELLRAAPTSARSTQPRRNLNRFFEEEIYSELSEPERGVLKVASLYRLPVPREALFADRSGTHDVLLALTNRSLLRSTEDDALVVHDTIRDFFAGTLTPTEREGLGRFALSQLRELASHARDAGNIVAQIDYLSNALQLAKEPTERAELFEALGDADERVGDLPSALTAYKEATQLVPSRETLARLHRKVASCFEIRGELKMASREVDEAVKALGDASGNETAWLAVVKTAIAIRGERWSEARSEGKRALEIFRHEADRRGQMQALLELANIEIEAPSDPSFSKGGHHVAEMSLTEALALSKVLGDAAFEGKVRTAMAHLFAYRLGDVDRALTQIAAIEALPPAARQLHDRRSLLMLKAWFQLELEGDYEASEQYFAEAAALARKIHDPTSRAFTDYGRALCSYFRGHVAESRPAFDAFAQEILQRGFPAYALEARWMVAECSLRQGDIPGFLAAVRSFDDHDLSQAVEARPVHVAVARGIEAFLRGDPVSCRAAFEEGLRLASRGYAIDETSLIHFVHSFYGIVLRVLGDDSAAEAHLREARAFLERYHLRARRAIFSAAEVDVVRTLRAAVTPL